MSGRESGRASPKRGRATATAMASVVLVLAAAGVRAADFDIAALFDRLAKERPARAEFRERKYLSLLAEPIDSSGELTFTPPDRLEKRTTSPKPETVVIDGTRITLERGGRTRALELEDNPGIAVLVESIRATLAGNLASLARAYSMALDGDASKWRLVLRPLDASLTSLVERIEIGGTEARVRTVAIFQADGDHSVMTISPAPAR